MSLQSRLSSKIPSTLTNNLTVEQQLRLTVESIDIAEQRQIASLNHEMRSFLTLRTKKRERNPPKIYVSEHDNEQMETSKKSPNNNFRSVALEEISFSKKLPPPGTVLPLLKTSPTHLRKSLKKQHSAQYNTKQDLEIGGNDLPHPAIFQQSLPLFREKSLSEGDIRVRRLPPLVRQLRPKQFRKALERTRFKEDMSLDPRFLGLIEVLEPHNGWQLRYIEQKMKTHGSMGILDLLAQQYKQTVTHAVRNMQTEGAGAKV